MKQNLPGRKSVINLNGLMGFIFGALAAVCLSSCCAPGPSAPPGGGRETLAQVSTLDALLVGAYGGQITYGELKRFGDFGLGTFDSLDGEMVAVDGDFYQIRYDGKVYPVSDSMTTPFAAVTFFDYDRKIELPEGTDYESLRKIVDGAIPTPNLFYAIRLDGVFSYLKTRSVPPQKKPYPPLVEVTKEQPEFEFENVTGTIVGFRCPPFVQGINLAGYHLHFLSEDKTGGGHVLVFSLKEGVISLDTTADFYLMLPESNGTFFSADFSRNREEDTRKAED